MWGLCVLLLLTVAEGFYEPPPARVVSTCFNREARITLDCRDSTVPGHIHILQVLHDYVTDPYGDCSVNHNPTSCHVMGTEWPNIRFCELQSSCDVNITSVQLDCGDSANYIAVRYMCLEGPPERISCALGTVCGHENSWRLSIDWHWDEGGQSSTIATTTSSGSTTPTPSPAGVTWSNWYDDGEEDPYESDGDWDAYNPDHGHRRRRRELPAKVIGASRNEQRINQIRKESVHSRHRRDEAVDPIVSAYISTAPHVVHLVSPNYPNNYTDRLDGACHIQTMAGSSLDLTVLRFHMEHHDICEFDWLHIETPWHSHKLCDTILPGSKEALNTDWARVMFHSDAWIMDTGFLISFTALDRHKVNSPLGIWCGRETSLEWFLDNHPPGPALISGLAGYTGQAVGSTDRNAQDNTVIGGLTAAALAEIVTAVAVGIVLIVLFVVLIIHVRRKTRRLSEATQTQPTTTVCNHMPPAYSAYGDVDGAGTNGDIAYANPVYDGLPEKINNVFENVEVDLGHDNEGNPVDKVPLHQV